MNKNKKNFSSDQLDNVSGGEKHPSLEFADDLCNNPTIQPGIKKRKRIKKT